MEGNHYIRGVVFAVRGLYLQRTPSPVLGLGIDLFDVVCIFVFEGVEAQEVAGDVLLGVRGGARELVRRHQ